jgi:hypothetical protein
LLSVRWLPLAGSSLAITPFAGYFRRRLLGRVVSSLAGLPPSVTGSLAVGCLLVVSYACRFARSVGSFGFRRLLSVVRFIKVASFGCYYYYYYWLLLLLLLLVAVRCLLVIGYCLLVIGYCYCYCLA